MNSIIIDGSHGKGGGQILRTALGLSVLFKKNIRVINIRKNRPNPGLRPSHLTTVKILKDLCNADVRGDYIGSTEVEFLPGIFKPTSKTIDIGTAGSISLLLQSLFIPAVTTDKKFSLEIKGGTDVGYSMPIDYFKNVFCFYYSQYKEVDVRVIKRGYYPKGGGLVKVSFKNKQKPQPINLERTGRLVFIRGTCHSSESLIKKAEKCCFIIKSKLNEFNVPVRLLTTSQNTLSNGYGSCIWAMFGNNKITHVVGADALGDEKKDPALIAGKTAIKLKEIISTDKIIDEHLADNMVPYLGLFGGVIIVSRLSNHIKSNIYTTEQFIGKKYVIESKRAGKLDKNGKSAEESVNIFKISVPAPALQAEYHS